MRGNDNYNDSLESYVELGSLKYFSYIDTSKKSLFLTLVTSFVVTVGLFMVDLAMKKDIFNPSI